jgi:hypothetical protein
MGSVQVGLLRRGERKSGQQTLDRSAGNADPPTDPEDGERKVAALDGPVKRGASFSQQGGGLFHAEERLG